MYSLFGFRHLLLIIILLVFAMPLDSYAEDDWTGTWYAAGMRLMEIKKLPNGKYVSELRHERENFKILAQVAPSLQGIEDFQHQANLLENGELVFADFEAVPSNFLKYYGLNIDNFSPDTVEMLELVESEKPYGRYFEKWRLDDQMRIEFISSFPNWLAVNIREDNIEYAENLKKRTSLAMKYVDIFIETNIKYTEWLQRDECGPHHEIFAWKITNTDELQGWEYFDNGNYQKAVDAFLRAGAAQPDNPFPRMACAWASIGTKDFNQARKKLQEARGLIKQDTRNALVPFGYFLEDQISSYETEALYPGQNIFNFTKNKLPNEIDKHINDLAKKEPWQFTGSDLRMIEDELKTFPAVNLMKEALSLHPYEHICFLGQDFFNYIRAQEENPAPNLDYIRTRYLVQVNLLFGHLQMRRGKVKDSIDAYASVVRFGRSLQHGSMLFQLIGLSFEETGLVSLGLIYQSKDKIISSEIQEYLGKTVSDLASEYERPSFERVTSSDLVYYLQPITVSDPLISSKVKMPFFRPDFRTCLIRTKIPDTYMALLSVASEISGLKGSAKDRIAQIELPEDPFAKGRKIGVAYTENTFKLYSVGPDGVSQGGKVLYDRQANGDNSGGDIVVTLYGIK